MPNYTIRKSRRKGGESCPYPGVYRRTFRKKLVYYARFQIPLLLVANLPSDCAFRSALARRRALAKKGESSGGYRTIHLGVFDDPETAAVAVELFALQFIVEYPWATIPVKDFLHSSGFCARAGGSADELLAYACETVETMHVTIADPPDYTADPLYRALQACSDECRKKNGESEITVPEEWVSEAM